MAPASAGAAEPRAQGAGEHQIREQGPQNWKAQRGTRVHTRAHAGRPGGPGARGGAVSKAVSEMAGGLKKPHLSAGMVPRAYAAPAPPRSQHSRSTRGTWGRVHRADSGGARGKHRLAAPSPRLGGVYFVRRPSGDGVFWLFYLRKVCPREGPGAFILCQSKLSSHV